MTIQRQHLDQIDFSDMAEDTDLIHPVPPGEILREDFMEPLGLSANALAKALHVPPNRITAILNGTRPITADTALRLAMYFTQALLAFSSALAFQRSRALRTTRSSREMRGLRSFMRVEPRLRCPPRGA